MSADAARKTDVSATGEPAGLARPGSPTLSADPVERMVAEVAAATGAHLAGLWLTDDPDRVRLVAALGTSAEFRLAAMSLGLAEAAPWSEVIGASSAIQARTTHRAGGRLAAALKADGLATVGAAPVSVAAHAAGGLPQHGFLLAGFRATQVIPEAALGMIARYAVEAGLLIDNGRLAASVERLGARLRGIEDLALRLNRIRDVRGIAEEIVAEVGRLISFDTVRVYLVDDANKVCEPVAFRGYFLGVADPSPEMLRVPMGAGLTGWVAVHGEPLYVPNSLEDPRSRFVGPDLGPESLLVVPMAYEGRVRGVIVLSQRGKDRFSDDDRTTIAVFAGHAAQALVNAENDQRLAAQAVEMQRQLGSQRRLLQVSEQLLASFDSRIVLESIADSLAAVLAYDSLTIYRFDRATSAYRAVIARDPYADQILADVSPITEGVTGWVITHREALLANDVHLDPRTVFVPGTPEEPESVLIVPLVSDGEVLGTLNVCRYGESHHFTQSEFDLTKLFAGQASMALRTAEAHEDAQARAALDPLTGLRHHGSFEADLGGRIVAGAPFALMMLDLDGFKAYNDTCGHPAGDALLRGAAVAMTRSVRATDHVYRYGGDEFAVILPGAGAETAAEAGDRIAEAVMALSTPGRPPVSISIGTAVFPEAGSTVAALVMAADERLYQQKRVREQRAIEQQLAQLGTGVAGGGRARANAVQARLSAAIEQASDGILMTDTEGRILYVNPAFERSTGYARADVLGQNPRILRSGAQSAPFYKGMWGTITEGRIWRGEMRNHRKDGSELIVEATISPLRDERGEITGFVGAQRDVTRERMSERAALKAARERTLVVEMLRKLPAGQPVEQTAEAICLQVATLEGIVAAALYVFEADGRAVHLALAPQPAEARALTLRASRHLRDRASAGGPWVEAEDRRTGRDLPADAPGERIAHAYVPVIWNGEPAAVLVATSESVAAVSHLTEQLALLAELGAIAAALIGPVLAGQAPLARKRAAIEQVIAAGAFHPVFQPIIDLRSGATVGHEALTRFDDGVGPDVRFAEASEAGVGLELEKATLRAALAAAAGLPARTWLSINVSPALVLDGTPLAELVERVGRPLLVEVTERERIDDYGAFRTAVAAIAPGVLLAIDDAGAGFSSLRHILELWPDFVKLDRSLVQGIDRDPARQALVAGMQHFATATDCQLIAEGIETQGEADALVELGVPFGQGFHLGRPAAL